MDAGGRASSRPASKVVDYWGKISTYSQSVLRGLVTVDNRYLSDGGDMIYQPPAVYPQSWTQLLFLFPADSSRCISSARNSFEVADPFILDGPARCLSALLSGANDPRTWPRRGGSGVPPHVSGGVGQWLARTAVAGAAMLRTLHQYLLKGSTSLNSPVWRPREGDRRCIRRK